MALQNQSKNRATLYPFRSFERRKISDKIYAKQQRH